MVIYIDLPVFDLTGDEQDFIENLGVVIAECDLDEVKKKQYDLYRQLCIKLGVEPFIVS